MWGKLLVSACFCGLLAGCGGGSSSSVVRVHSSPTPDAVVAQVKATVTAFIVAYAKSEESGDSTAVRKLTVAGSPAEGNADGFAASTISSGTGFKTLRVDINQATWKVSLAPGNSASFAEADVTWSAFGHVISYPSGRRIGPDKESQTFADHFALQILDGKWLVASF